MVHELFSSINSHPTGGQLVAFTTTEKLRQRFWPNFKEDNKFFFSSCEQCHKRVSPPKTQKLSLSEWPPATAFIILESILWVPYHCLTVISVY